MGRDQWALADRITVIWATAPVHIRELCAAGSTLSAVTNDNGTHHVFRHRLSGHNNTSRVQAQATWPQRHITCSGTGYLVTTNPRGSTTWMTHTLFKKGFIEPLKSPTHVEVWKSKEQTEKTLTPLPWEQVVRSPTATQWPPECKTRGWEAFWSGDQMREYFHTPAMVACTDESCIENEVQGATLSQCSACHIFMYVVVKRRVFHQWMHP